MGPNERAAKIEELITQCHSGEYSQVIDAIGELERLEVTEVAHHVLFLLQDHDIVLRSATAELLGKVADIGDELVGDALIPLLQDEDSYVRNRAAEALGELVIKKSAPQLVKLLHNDADSLVRICAAEALGIFRDPSLLEPLKLALQDEHEVVLAYVVEAISLTNHSDARAVIREYLTQEYNLYVRAWIFRALYYLGDEEAAKEMEDLYLYTLMTLRPIVEDFRNEITGKAEAPKT